MLGNCCGIDSAGWEDGGRRGKHCLKPITHWLMILSSHLATPFSHSLPLLTLSQIKRGVIHSSLLPGGQENATMPSRVRLTASEYMLFPKLLSRCRFLHNFIAAALFFCLACLSCVRLAPCVRMRCFFESVADLLLLLCYCGVRVENVSVSVPVTKMSDVFPSSFKVSIDCNPMAV